MATVASLFNQLSRHISRLVFVALVRKYGAERHDDELSRWDPLGAVVLSWQAGWHSALNKNAA